MSIEGFRPIEPSPEFLFPPHEVIVVGGNVAGATAAYCLKKYGVQQVKCFDPFNIAEGVSRRPPCSGCGGLIQGRTENLLNNLGLTIPEEVVRRRLDGYTVHLPKGGKIQVDTPLVSVFRGHGPIQGDNRHIGFDQAILEQAQQAGVEFIRGEVTGIQLGVDGGNARVDIRDGKTLEADFVVGAFGHNSRLVKNIVVPEGYDPLDIPSVRTSAVNELYIGEDKSREFFGNRAHVVIIPIEEAAEMNVWFAAFVPKDAGTVTMILMGLDDVKSKHINSFMNSKYARRLLPPEVINNGGWQKLRSAGGCSQCQCQSNTITIEAPQHVLIPIPGGFVGIGDAGSTRPLKDGIGAAAATAAQAARAIATGDFESFRQYIDECYPHDDHLYAARMMRLNDRILALPHMETLLTYLLTHPVPGISNIVRDKMLDLLTGNGPYKKMLPSIIGDL